MRGEDIASYKILSREEKGKDLGAHLSRATQHISPIIRLELPRRQRYSNNVVWTLGQSSGTRSMHLPVNSAQQALSHYGAQYQAPRARFVELGAKYSVEDGGCAVMRKPGWVAGV